MAVLKQNELIARARAANKTFIDQNLLSQEINCPTKELKEATKREELRVPVKTPGRDLEQPASKKFVIEIPASKTTPEIPAPTPPPPQPSSAPLPSRELLGEISLKVTLAIENSKLTAAKMTEATRIFEEVKIEIQKAAPDWNKVTGHLKKSLDYGLPIGSEIVNLAAIYHRAKVTVAPPKKEPKEMEIKHDLQDPRD